MFVPECPVNESVPAVAVYAHDFFLELCFVFATHFPLTVRPFTEWLKLKVTDAASFSVNEKVVPTGGPFAFVFLLICASALPSRHVSCVCEGDVTAGVGGGDVLGVDEVDVLAGGSVSAEENPIAQEALHVVQLPVPLQADVTQPAPDVEQSDVPSGVIVCNAYGPAEIAVPIVSKNCQLP